MEFASSYVEITEEISNLVSVALLSLYFIHVLLILI